MRRCSACRRVIALAFIIGCSVCLSGCQISDGDDKPFDWTLASGHYGQSGYSEHGASFDDLFEYSHAVSIDTMIVIGSASRFSTADDGAFVVLDRRPRQALLFDPAGRFLSELEPSECHPGLPWSPDDALAMRDGRWLVSSISSGAFLFDQQGKCLGPISERMDTGYSHWAEGSDGSLFGMKISELVLSIDQFNLAGSAPSQVAKLPVSASSQLGKTLGGFLGANGALYAALPSSPIIAKFTEGEMDTSPPAGIGFAPDYFKMPGWEDTHDGSASASERIMRLYESQSLIFDSFLIDSTTLAVLHFNGHRQKSTPSEAFGIQVIDLESSQVLSGPILFSGREAPGAGGNGFMYRLSVPTDEEALSGASPALQVFRFRQSN